MAVDQYQSNQCPIMEDAAAFPKGARCPDIVLGIAKARRRYCGSIVWVRGTGTIDFGKGQLMRLSVTRGGTRFVER